MKVYYRKKILTEINSVSDLELFVLKNNLYKFFKKFPSCKIDKIQSSINLTKDIAFKQVKPWIRSILQYPESIYNPNFLLSMGWEYDEIQYFISQLQIKNSSILTKKKLESPELYFSSTTSRVEYWISKGFNEKDSKIKLSERQKTFSKEICINKYGKEEGSKIFKERQIKWVSTLQKNQNYDEVQLKKNSYNYLEKSYKSIIERSSFIQDTKNIILKYINIETINSFVDCILTEIDVKRFSDILPYINSSIIQNKFNCNREDIKKIFYSKTFYSLKNQIYGVAVYHNGIRFKSIKEYEISLFLDSKGVKYVYEKNYPNSKFISDFYLPEKNLYIEYYGMLDGKNMDKLDEIQKKYKEKMLEKNLFFVNNNLQLIYNISYTKLINDLNKIL